MLAAANNGVISLKLLNNFLRKKHINSPISHPKTRPIYEFKHIMDKNHESIKIKIATNLVEWINKFILISLPS